MHHQLARAARGHGLGTFARQGVIVVAQAHLGRDGHASRHGAAHGGHHGLDLCRVAQQRRTATMAVHDLGGAAKVQVHPLGPQLGQARGVLGHAHGVGAQQLRAHRHACQGAAAMAQLGHGAQECAFGQQRAGDTDELRHTAVHAAHAREQVAQHAVEQALHRSKQ